METWTSGQGAHTFQTEPSCPQCSYKAGGPVPLVILAPVSPLQSRPGVCDVPVGAWQQLTHIRWAFELCPGNGGDSAIFLNPLPSRLLNRVW